MLDCGGRALGGSTVADMKKVPQEPQTVADKEKTAKDAAAEIKASNDDLETYRQFVAGIAKASDGTVIFNRSEAHAAIIIEYLFGASKNEVNILTGELYRPVYGAAGVVTAAIAFLEREPESKINIVSEYTIPSEHPFLKAVRAVADESRIKISVLKAAVAKQMPFHFAVSDGISFRFEPKKEVLEAMVQFGAKEVGGKLTEVFRDLQSHGTA
jgi:hypothetical protein